MSNACRTQHTARLVWRVGKKKEKENLKNRKEETRVVFAKRKEVGRGKDCPKDETLGKGGEEAREVGPSSLSKASMVHKKSSGTG